MNTEPAATTELPSARRSRAGNGRLPHHVDGRSAEARRLRELTADLEAAALAVGPLTPARRLLVSRAAGAALLAEQIECGILNGNSVDGRLADGYLRACGTVSRCLRSLGIETGGLGKPDKPDQAAALRRWRERQALA